MKDHDVQYRVEPVTPSEARTDLLRIWAENLPLASPAEHKYGWLYREAPDLPKAVFLLKAVRAGGGSPSAVGSSGVLPRTLQVGERLVRAGLLADLAVDKDHRTAAPALRLMRATRQFALTEFDLAYGMPNPTATPVFRRVGYRQLGTMRRFVRLLRHGGYMDRLAGHSRVPPRLARFISDERFARLAGPVVDAARLLWSAPDTLGAWGRYTLEWLDRADDRFDDLWERACREYEVVGRRSARYLRWRFPVGPRTRIAALFSRGPRVLSAYAVIQLPESRPPARRRAAHVMDLFGHVPALPALLDYLLASLWRRGETALSLRFLGNPHIAEVLRSRGFREFPGTQPVFVGVGAGLAEQDDLLADPRSWHLLDGDNDV